MALKGFVREKGRTLEEFEGFGHELGKLLELCTMHGLVLSERDAASIVSRFDKALPKARLREEVVDACIDNLGDF